MDDFVQRALMRHSINDPRAQVVLKGAVERPSLTQMLDEIRDKMNPSDVLAMNPADVTGAVRAELENYDVELHEKDFVPRGKAYIIDRRAVER